MKIKKTLVAVIAAIAFSAGLMPIQPASAENGNIACDNKIQNRGYRVRRKISSFPIYRNRRLVEYRHVYQVRRVGRVTCIWNVRRNRARLFT